MQPEFFERIVKNSHDLMWLRISFPDKEIFNNTYEKTLLLVKLNSSTQKAYTRGACMGMFDQLNMPNEISGLIGNYLDGASGLRVAQTCNKALLTAKEEQSRFNQMQ